MDYKKELEELILTVVRLNGSDLHLGVGRKPAIRVAGELVFLEERSALTEEYIYRILGETLEKTKIDKFKETKEINFSYDFRGEIRVRGNAFFQKGLVNVVFRLVQKVKTLSELRLPAILAELACKKQGFFLVVGPTGQGKSTTLSAMVNVINTEQTKHIITIEDPIEYTYPIGKSIINQREVGVDTEDFHVALREVFREDVNVIMIGEMRTPETISAAVTAAETGHLVFSTLHTNNASQAIDRIIDSFPGNQQDQIRTQLSTSLLGIFSQRLIPKISGGLVPAYELLLNNKAVGNLIREKRTHEIDVVIETSSESGMIDLNHSLVELVRRGEITIENARQYSFNPKGIDRMI